MCGVLHVYPSIGLKLFWILRRLLVNVVNGQPNRIHLLGFLFLFNPGNQCNVTNNKKTRNKNTLNWFNYLLTSLKNILTPCKKKKNRSIDLSKQNGFLIVLHTLLTISFSTHFSSILHSYSGIKCVIKKYLKWLFEIYL